MATSYRICARCVMDTSDPEIQFDAQGICNRCREFEATARRLVPPAAARQAQLDRIVAQMKAEGRGREYDCIIGVSGGVDSTYVAYVCKRQLGLRCLAVHLDNGWDSELAVSNIENCLKRLDIDLHTEVLDWDEFRDLQVAFLKASTPDSEIPTDHAILALMMRKAVQHGVRFVVSGVNAATEGLFAPAWSRGHYDWKYIRAVHRRFGTVPLRSFPHFTLTQLAWMRYLRRLQFVYALNYLDYDKRRVLELIQRELGWKPYQGKHHESIYTRFFQGYILPRKFGFDKRRMHLSTLIMSGQMTREAALAELEKEIYSPDLVRQDKVYVPKKLGLTEQQFEDIMNLPRKTFWDYPSAERTLPVRLLRAWQRRKQARALAPVVAPAPERHSEASLRT